MQADAPTLRQRQARETRARIVAEARALFAHRGYGATTIADIAAAAGVAVPTVYKAVGNKPELLAAIVESWRVRFIPGGLDSAPPGAAAAIAWWAGTARRQWETGYDIAMIFAGAMAGDPAVRAELATRLTWRSAAVQHVGDAVAASPRAPVDAQQAAAIVSALTLPEVYRELVHDRGWTPDEYQAWVERTLVGQLLAPEPPR